MPAEESPGDPAILSDLAISEGAPPTPVSEELHEADAWQPPPAQPLLILLALAFTAIGAGLYGFVLTSFWSSPNLGIHGRIPYPAYALIALSMLTTLAGLRLSLGIWSPHAKLGIGLFGFLTCVVVGVGGGRFVSYTLRGTLNPPFTLHLARGDRFPDFSLPDQHGAIHSLRDLRLLPLTLLVVYRGDFCPYARFELADLTAHRVELRNAGVDVVAISADSSDRSLRLASFLRTDIPLLADRSESLLQRLGLVWHRRDREPDTVIPAYFLVDRDAVVRWLFTSPYYRELPSISALRAAADSITAAR